MRPGIPGHDGLGLRAHRRCELEPLPRSDRRTAAAGDGVPRPADRRHDHRRHDRQRGLAARRLRAGERGAAAIRVRPGQGGRADRSERAAAADGGIRRRGTRSRAGARDAGPRCRAVGEGVRAGAADTAAAGGARHGREGGRCRARRRVRAGAADQPQRDRGSPVLPTARAGRGPRGGVVPVARRLGDSSGDGFLAGLRFHRARGGIELSAAGELVRELASARGDARGLPRAVPRRPEARSEPLRRRAHVDSQQHRFGRRHRPARHGADGFPRPDRGAARARHGVSPEVAEHGADSAPAGARHAAHLCRPLAARDSRRAGRRRAAAASRA